MTVLSQDKCLHISETGYFLWLVKCRRQQYLQPPALLSSLILSCNPCKVISFYQQKRGDNQCCGDRLFQYLVPLPVSIDTLCTESSKVCLQHCFSTMEALAAFQDGGVSWYAVLTSVPYESLIASCTKILRGP